MTAPAAGATRRVDWPSAAMTLVAVAALGWAAWLRFLPPPPAAPPAIGAFPPPLRLLDAADGQPVVLLGRGKVVWLAFWSAASPTAAADLSGLERAWGGLKARPRFVAIVAAVDADRIDRIRAARSEAKAGRPVYLATPETRRAFGVADPPLHLLIGADGRVAAVARGWQPATLDRLARQAEAALDELEPFGSVRLAAIPPPTFAVTTLANPGPCPPPGSPVQGTPSSLGDGPGRAGPAWCLAPGAMQRRPSVRLLTHHDEGCF